MKKTSSFIALVTLLPLLAGCGHTTSDRALSGAGIGAGVGAVGGAIAGGSVLVPTLIGAGAGAIIGGVSDDHKIDLGRPLWRR